MKLQDLLVEMPAMVSQSVYPFEQHSKEKLKRFTEHPPQGTKVEHEQGQFRLVSTRPEELFLLHGNNAIGLMQLASSHVDVGVPAWQVMNVYIKPRYRNQQLGLMMYNHIIHGRGEAFASGAAMTPASRRVYTSLFRDPTVDAYALTGEGRVELSVGPDGVTTGDPAIDRRAVFVLTEK